MTTTLSVEFVPLDDLRPDPANPRRIGEDELDALERSLRQFGFVQPVLARRDDRTVIGGHQRLVAAEVMRIVEACTDADTHPKPPWRVRKEAYVAHLATMDR